MRNSFMYYGAVVVITTLLLTGLMIMGPAEQESVWANDGGAKKPWAQSYAGILQPTATGQYKGSPAVQFPVTAIHKRVGDRVGAGDLLITLDPAPHPIERAKSLLQVAREEHDRAKDQSECYEELRKRGTVSYEEVAVAKTGMVVKKHLVEVAKRDLLTAEYWDSMQFLKTPIDGVIVEVNVVRGEVARPENKPVVWVWVIDDSVLEAECLVPLADSWLLEKEKTKVTVVQHGKEIQGTVSLIGPMANDAGQIPVRVLVPNKDGQLKIKTKVTVNFEK